MYRYTGKDENNRSLIRAVRHAVSRGDLAGLERAYRAVLESDEGLSEGWFVVGMLCLQRGDIEEAYDSLSEFTALESAGEDAGRVEVLLYFLESLDTETSALSEELEEEMAATFLKTFGAPLGEGRTFAGLDGISLQEAMRTPGGRRSILALLRGEEIFGREALEHARRFVPV